MQKLHTVFNHVLKSENFQPCVWKNWKSQKHQSRLRKTDWEQQYLILWKHYILSFLYVNLNFQQIIYMIEKLEVQKGLPWIIPQAPYPPGHLVPFHVAYE